MKDQYQQKKDFLLKLLIIFTSIALAFNIAIVVLMAIMGYTGFGTYSSTTLCNVYLTYKHQTLKQYYYKASFIVACLSTIMLIVQLALHIKNCFVKKSAESQQEQYEMDLLYNKWNRFNYIMYSLEMVFLCVVVGRYLSLLLQSGIQCQNIFDLYWCLIAASGFLSMIFVGICWVLIFKQCLDNMTDTDSEGLQVQFNKNRQPKDLYQRQMQAFYSTIRQIDGNDPKQKLLYQNSAIPFYHNSDNLDKNIMQQLKKEMMVGMKKQQMKSQFLNKKQQYKLKKYQFDRNKKNQVKTQQEVNHANIILKGMNKTFGQLIIDAVRPRRFPQPTSLIYQQKNSHLLSFLGVKIQGEQETQQKKKQRLNMLLAKRMNRTQQQQVQKPPENKEQYQIPFKLQELIPFKMQKKQQNISQKQQSPPIQKQMTPPPSLFANLFAATPATPQTSNLALPQESRNNFENSMGKSSYQMSIRDIASSLIANQTSQEVQDPSLYYYKPKIISNAPGKVQKQLFENDFIDAQTYNQEHKDKIVINKIKGNHKVSIQKNKSKYETQLLDRRIKTKNKTYQQKLVQKLKTKYGIEQDK